MSAHFGLDIGSHSIKIIKADKEKNQYRLESYGEILTPAQLDSGLDKDQIAVAEAVKKLMKAARVKSRQAVLALPEPQAYSQIIKLPHLSKSEIASAIKFEAEQYIPVPLREVQLEYQILGAPSQEPADQQMEILLIAAKKTAIEKILQLCKLADVEPVSLETETLATIRALVPATSEFRLIVNFDKNSTSIILAKGNNLRLVRTLNTGGAAITRVVASEFNMAAIQAEKYKIAYGLLPDQLEGKVAAAIISILALIIREIKQSLIFFGKQYPGGVLRSVILSGGTAMMPGLTTYLAKQLSLEVTAADPFASFIRDKRFPQALLAGRSKFSTAVGLAIKET